MSLKSPRLSAAWNEFICCPGIEIDVSASTLRHALHALGYRWKRPRDVLRRRIETWRQAKGGLKRGLAERKRTVVLFSDAAILSRKRRRTLAGRLSVSRPKFW